MIQALETYLPAVGLGPCNLANHSPLDIVLPPGQERIGSFLAEGACGETWLIDLRRAASQVLLSRQCWIDFQPSEQALLEKSPWRNPKQNLLILYIVPDVSALTVTSDVPAYFLFSSCYKRVRRAYLPDTGAIMKDSIDVVPSTLTTTARGVQPTDGPGVRLPSRSGRQGEGGLRVRGLCRTRNDHKPTVSIVTVVRNNVLTLERNIQSVLNQTYGNIEQIIVDGGSTDGTLDILRRYDDAVDYWISEPDKNIYEAMNKGLWAATGEWVNFLNSDDFYASPYVLASTFDSSKALESLDLIFGDAFIVSRRRGSYFPSRFWSKLLVGNTVHHQAAFYKRALFNDFQYDESFRILGDYELNLMLFLRGSKTLKLSRVMAICEEGGISRQVRLAIYTEEMRIRRRHLGVRKSLVFDFLALVRYVKNKILYLLRKSR